MSSKTSDRRDNQDPSPGPGFATTHWSLVAAAGERDEQGAREALAELCTRYWYPLYAWLRRQGDSHESAQDLVQAFLLELIERQRLAAADPERGRFRTFLLASLKNFRANDQRREQALKRGGGVSAVPIDFADADQVWTHEPYHELTADLLFDRKWALQLLSRGLDRLQQLAEERGRGELFRLVRPLLSGDSGIMSYDEIAARTAMQPGAIKVAVHRWREQFGELIRNEIRQTVVADDEVDGELEHLFRILSGP